MNRNERDKQIPSSGESIIEQEKARQRLMNSGFVPLVKELTKSLPGLSVHEVAWDNFGNCTVEDVKGKPNSVGLVINLEETRVPEIESGKLLGIRIRFKTVAIESRTDGGIDMKGFGVMKNKFHNWDNEEDRRKSLLHALERPARHSILKPIPDSLSRQLYQYEPLLADTVDYAIEEMLKIANERHVAVLADFNGVALIVKPGDDRNNVLARWNQTSRRQYSEHKSSYEAKRIERELKERIGKEKQQFEKETRRPIATFSVKNIEGWKKILDIYKDNARINVMIHYVARWAKMMEKELSAGAKLEDAVNKTQRKADIAGVLGFRSFSSIVSVLVRYWEHGEELRIWYISKYGNQEEKVGGKDGK